MRNTLVPLDVVPEPDRPAHNDSGENCDPEITGKMIDAGVSVLFDLEGEVSKAYLARAVFQAMMREWQQ